MELLVKMARVHPEVEVPERAYRFDAGLDLCADGDFEVGNELEIIPSGLRIAIPKGRGGIIYPRSSWLARGLVVFPTVIDTGFQGEVKIMCHAPWHDVFVKKGDRIAQIVFHDISNLFPEFVSESVFLNSKSLRGMSGFGSTGKRGKPTRNAKRD